MIKPYPLPYFANGVVASAAELNLISQAQSFLNGAFGLLNFPYEYTHRDITVYCLHRFRYLHWRNKEVTDAILRINGVTVGPVASSATTGHVDLGFGFNGGSSNPYNLTLNQPYPVVWADHGLECRMMYEHVESTGVLSLPTTPPTFSGVLQASPLNTVCDDTDYLLGAAITPITGFTAQDYGLGDGTKSMVFTVYHMHRYLHYQGYYKPSGTTGSGLSRDFKIEINGDKVFADVVQEDHIGHYNIAIDLAGSNNVKFSGDGNFYLNVAPSGFYEIVMTAEGADPFSAALHNDLLCESPYATQL